MLLNLGAGETWSHAKRPWINIDVRVDTKPDVVADVLHLPFADGTAEAIYAGHLLEHIDRENLAALMVELQRVLVSAGRLLVVGPDVERALRLWSTGVIDKERMEAAHTTRDGHGNPALHQWDCSGPLVVTLLEDSGFEDVHELDIAATPQDFPVYDRVTADQFAVLGQRP